MGGIVRFEDLVAWKEARELNRSLAEIYGKPNLKKEFYICGQVKRSAISVMANIAEGFGRYGLKDSRNFYIIARGSLTETQSHLYAIKDLKYLSEEEFEGLFQKTILVSKLINGLISNAGKLLKRNEVNL